MDNALVRSGRQSGAEGNASRGDAGKAKTRRLWALRHGEAKEERERDRENGRERRDCCIARETPNVHHFSTSGEVHLLT